MVTKIKSQNEVNEVHPGDVTCQPKPNRLLETCGVENQSRFVEPLKARSQDKMECAGEAVRECVEETEPGELAGGAVALSRIEAC